jgi:hypothetical protein
MPFHFCGGLRLEGLERPCLWGCPVKKTNDGFELHRCGEWERTKYGMYEETTVPLQWDISKARNITYTLRGSREMYDESYVRLMQILRAIDRITTLDLVFVFNVGRDLYFDKHNREYPYSKDKHLHAVEKLPGIERVMTTVQKYGDLMKSAVSGKVRDAKMQVLFEYDYRLSKHKGKEVHAKFEDYRKQWERDTVRAPSEIVSPPFSIGPK